VKRKAVDGLVREREMKSQHRQDRPGVVWHSGSLEGMQMIVEERYAVGEEAAEPSSAMYGKM
jgi:hypothetical protein